ncbi:MAG: hypothetical protein KTR20_09580 [Cellvibrionaceae bacterium]|nr:hypothetical protein [Cellvibrionaceae bacterium]
MLFNSEPSTSPVLDTAERRVVRQLLEAVLFEQMVPFRTRPRDASETIGATAETIFDQVFSFKLGGLALRALGTLSAFERVRLAPGSIHYFRGATQQWCEVSLDRVIAALDISDTAKATLQQELIQTLALCRWNDKHLGHRQRLRRKLNFQALESAIVEGHLYHPCFKTRTGFSENDHARYGPEAANYFQLVWLAVKHCYMDTTLPQQETIFWQREIGVDVYQHLSEQLFDLGGSWDGYGLLPIHPWQYHAILPLGLAQALKVKDILLLGKAGDFYQSSQSLRTLINVSNPLKANLKLSLNVICTSSHRNLQSHFVHTAPVISSWLQQRLASDDYLQKQNNTLLLSEYAGLLYQPQHNKALIGRIGVIFRESVLCKLMPGQAVVPFSALMLVEADGLPFINDWLEAYGIETWVKQLLSTMLVPLWHFLVHHGIAFEAHAQNLLLIHRNGWPEKIVLRDFHEDTEFVPDFLRNPDEFPALAAVDPYFNTIALNEGFAMADIGALRELFMDTVYVFNLADLAFLVATFYNFSDQAFWQVVNDQLAAYAAADITDKKRLQQIGADSKQIVVESLLTKKISGGDILDYYQHRVSNRLYQPSC